MTSFELQMYEAKQAARAGRITSGQPVARERDLHAQIEELCAQNRWLYVHSRMDRPATNQAGTPDFIIALPNGRTLWVECKSKSGKLSNEQIGRLVWLRSLGHLAIEARCIEDVLREL